MSDGIKRGRENEAVGRERETAGRPVFSVLIFFVARFLPNYFLVAFLVSIVYGQVSA